MSGVQQIVRNGVLRPNVGCRVLANRYFGLSAVSCLKSNLPFKWYRPEKIPCIQPEKSGDLEPVMKLDLKSTPPLEFQDSEELRTADDIVKRLFTLEFFPHQKTAEVLKAKYMGAVKRHALDEKSHEARISRMTARIRDLQSVIGKQPKNKLMKVRLKETIDKRKRLLLELREHDYKCFEFILETLNLEYKPQPPPDAYLRVERKRSLRLLCDEYCKNIVQSRLASYKNQLDAKKESFLENKLNTLKWIVKEEKECGVSPTVSDEEIAAVAKQLDDLRKANAEAKQNEDIDS